MSGGKFGNDKFEDSDAVERWKSSGPVTITESEYGVVVNRVNISAALCILRDVLPGDGYGVTDHEMKEIMIKVRGIEERLFSLIETVEG